MRGLSILQRDNTFHQRKILNLSSITLHLQIPFQHSTITEIRWSTSKERPKKKKRVHSCEYTLIFAYCSQRFWSINLFSNLNRGTQKCIIMEGQAWGKIKDWNSAICLSFSIFIKTTRHTSNWKIKIPFALLHPSDEILWLIQ